MPLDGDNCSGWEQRSRQEISAVKTNCSRLRAFQTPETLRDISHKTEQVRIYTIYKIPTGREWHKGHCLMIGDAAHAMPPHASQDVSMALEDSFLFQSYWKFTIAVFRMHSRCTWRTLPTVVSNRLRFSQFIYVRDNTFCRYDAPQPSESLSYQCCICLRQGTVFRFGVYNQVESGLENQWLFAEDSFIF